MTPTRSLAAALALGSALWAGCYSEPIAPSTYRYACDADADCNANETCRRGRCEQPCATLEVVVAGLLGTEQPCTTADGVGVCVNGACGTTCALGSDYCSPGHTCLDVGISGLTGGGGNPLGGGGSSDALGVCGFECDDELCAPGEECVEGLCQPIDCSLGQACPDGLGCFFGFCVQGCAGGETCAEGTQCSPLFGVCEPTCTPACGEGELCFFGACAIDCSGGEECPDGQACFFGVCALEQDAATDGGSGSDTNAGSDTSGGSEDGGSTADTGATDDGSATGTTGMGADPDHHEDRR